MEKEKKKLLITYLLKLQQLISLHHFPIHFFNQKKNRKRNEEKEKGG